MTFPKAERRLSAILVADVVGYSRLVEVDERATLAAIKHVQRDLLEPLLSENRGRLVKLLGDGFILEYNSVVDAVTTAASLQRALRADQEGVAQERRIVLRIGINVGDIVAEDGDLLGDGVNVASRLEQLCPPGGVLISGTAYDHLQGKLDTQFVFLGEKQLKNIARPIRAYETVLEPVPPEAATSQLQNVVRTADLQPRAQPSIAVLPFANVTGDPEQEFLSDGLAEDIITALALLRWLFVIARNSSFTYKGRPVDVRQVAHDLGIRYVLQGSVRTAGQRIRVTAQLIDAETGKHIWGEKYDRDLQDIFAVQDDITERVVAAVEPHLYVEEGYKASTRPPDSIDAWGLVTRAINLLGKVERATNEEAQQLLRRAIAMEPRYARAHALLGWAIWWATLCLWFRDLTEGYRQAGAHAQEALALDPSDPWARMVSGLTLSTAGQHERALGEIGKALTLNPSFALGHTALGWALLRAGWFDEAIAETEQALRLSPLDSLSGLYTTVHGLALLSARRFEEALPFLRAAVDEFPDYSGHYNTLISCCGHLGLIDEARELLVVRNRIGTPLRLAWVREQLSRFAHCAVFVEGLAKAGVPE
jgi:adenylate cyclase